VDEDGVDEWHERVEATQDEGVAAECLDVADAVEDIEQHRVVEPLELIHGLGLAASIPSKLQAHRSGSRRCVGAGQGESRDGKDVRKHNQRRVEAVVPQEPFLFAASIHENRARGRDGGYLQFRHFRHFILTECYFQFTVQSFGGILRRHKLSILFYRDRDLSMLHNQFFHLYLTILGKKR
jgi:hypothetical protein